MPRVADVVRNLKIRLLPPANIHPRRGAPAPGTPQTAAHAVASADSPRDEGAGARLLVEIALNPLHRQKVTVEGEQLAGLQLLTRALQELERGLRLHGAKEEQGPPPPSRKEKNVRAALRRM
jgi:hypothetical protein